MWCDKRLHIFISGDDLRLRQIDVSSWQMCFVVDVGGWWWPPFNIKLNARRRIVLYPD